MNKSKDASPSSAFSGLIDNLMPENHEGDTADLSIDEAKEIDSDGVVDLSLNQGDKEKEPEEKGVQKKDDDKKGDDDKVTSKEDGETLFEDPDEDIDNDDKEKEIDNEDPDKEDEEEKIDPSEKAGVSQFFDAFSEALGWDIDEDEEKPSTVNELIDYMRSVIDENSTPEYADDRIKDLDEYVKKGGNFEDFYKKQSNEIDYDKIDMEDEDNQKRVVRDYLAASGFNDDQIKRRLERFEDAGILADEAKDNVEWLKEYEKNEKEQLQKQQDADIRAQEEKQQQLITNITDNINTLTEVRGVHVPAEDRKKLLEYAFKTDGNGLTQFQKDYAKNATKNFIETAYFSMKGDALIKSAKHSGESSAVNKLRQTLKTSTKRTGSKQSMDNTTALPVFQAASSLLGR